MMLNKREHKHPCGSPKKNQQGQIFHMKDQKKITEKIRSISIFVLQIWMETHTIGMRQLPPTVSGARAHAVLNSLARNQNCWSICRNHSSLL